MILYLSSNEHTNLLDFLEWNEDFESHTIKKMVGNFILKQFVLYDMRNFSHCTKIILDRTAFADTDSEFTEAIQEFQMMYHARITVIYEGLNINDKLFTQLLDCGVGNIVRGVTIEEIRTEVRECFSVEGMNRYQIKEIRNQEKEADCYQFDCENIRIVLISAIPRIGVTTVAIGMTSWLAGAGAKVNYIEGNGKGHLSYITHVYHMEQMENGYYTDNAGFYFKEPVNSGNFNIYDLGNEFRQRMDIVEKADILIMTCGTKPYELAETIKLLREFETKKAFVLCPFVNKKDQDNIAGAFMTKFHQVLFSEYQPDFFDGNANGKLFKRIIEDYMGLSGNR